MLKPKQPKSAQTSSQLQTRKAQLTQKEMCDSGACLKASENKI